MAASCHRAPNTKPKDSTNNQSFDVFPTERVATVTGAEDEDELLAGGAGGGARLKECGGESIGREGEEPHRYLGKLSAQRQSQRSMHSDKDLDLACRPAMLA